MRVLGLDPGTATFGWGVVETGSARPAHVAHGALRTAATLTLGARLSILRDGVTALIDEHRPDRIAIERIFSQSNVQSAVAIGAVRGVALLIAAGHEVEQVDAGLLALVARLPGRVVRPRRR